MMRRLNALIVSLASLPVAGLAQPTVVWQETLEPAATEPEAINWEHFSSGSNSQNNGVQWRQLSDEQSNQLATPSWKSQPEQKLQEEKPQTTQEAPTKKPPSPYTWPNGQPMSPEDKKFYSTAYSRGGEIQIGDTYYPYLGFNALQRQPNSWGSISIDAIDNSFQGLGVATSCSKGDFTSGCADAVLEAYVRLWNSKDFSLDLQWSMHSLSGPGSPFPIAGRTGGTAFGEGQSLGFKLSKNITNTFGISLGANRLFHLDQTTDLPKNLYLIGTKIIRTNQKPDSPIVSISLGIMSDVYNPNTNIGTMGYPPWLRGGEYPSLFAERYDKRQATSSRGYYPNVAGVTSPFVCAEQSIFQGKPLGTENPDCITKVFVGPVASIGFAPVPWLGFYAIYQGNLDLGISLRPIKNVPWTISVKAVQPFTGINPRDDAYISEYPCAGQNLTTCRTRVGLFTELAF